MGRLGSGGGFPSLLAGGYLQFREYPQLSGTYNRRRYLTAYAKEQNLWYGMVEYVTIFNKEDIRFTFKDGTEIRV